MTRAAIHYCPRIPRRGATTCCFLTAARRPSNPHTSFTSAIRQSITLPSALQHQSQRQQQHAFHTSSARLLSHLTEDDQQQKSHHHQPPHNNKKTRTHRFLLLALLTLPALSLPIFLSSSHFLSKPNTLNPTTFTPFTITSREEVSPTAFILTVGPPSSSSADVIRQAWHQLGLWSVEIKQPQLQVAREYTPLPPENGDGDEGDATMRFLIRRVHGGEVSSYLARLRVGDMVEIRGPRGGFDVRARLGVGGDGGTAAAGGDGGGDRDRTEEGGRRELRAGGEGEKEVKEKKKKVVFLAGGTGIAPALQAARRILSAQPTSSGVEMEVVWANRRREDCLGCEGTQEQGTVVAMLEEMRAKYGDRFRYTCTVDEEGSFIDAGTVTRATGVAGRGASNSWWPWPKPNNTPASQPSALFIDSDQCRYHSAKRLVVSADQDPPAGTESEECRCVDIDGSRVKGGKNLLIVSGPDGFIARYVGAKMWGDGKELQGPVKAMVGELRRKYPSLADEWLVLKM
ncbi:hypothetical protein N656DRAFT_782488 [Canariomyces notabilis]|uniref:FAD-binding FR-type domain-containing protein n=1 Tax=Canariomyces notabilis TaxID=2074819 RepID=A0AAN6QK47_9PEZI|nr:hypothetical protein N656DRAFT_782488 [Canariomyces arenarius]